MYDNNTFPNPSFNFIISAVILSPTLKESRGSSFSLNEYSALGIIPSALYPISTKISPCELIFTILPVTVCPILISFNV